MCICVNCHYVDRCIVYHEVEHLHGQPHLTIAPTFEPTNPSINANVRLPEVLVTADGRVLQSEIGNEYDVVGCDSFRQELGKWSHLRPGEPVPT